MMASRLRAMAKLQFPHFYVSVNGMPDSYKSINFLDHPMIGNIGEIR